MSSPSMWTNKMSSRQILKVGNHCPVLGFNNLLAHVYMDKVISFKGIWMGQDDFHYKRQDPRIQRGMWTSDMRRQELFHRETKASSQAFHYFASSHSHTLVTPFLDFFHSGFTGGGSSPTATHPVLSCLLWDLAPLLILLIFLVFYFLPVNVLNILKETNKLSLKFYYPLATLLLFLSFLLKPLDRQRFP